MRKKRIQSVGISKVRTFLAKGYFFYSPNKLRYLPLLLLIGISFYGKGDAREYWNTIISFHVAKLSDSIFHATEIKDPSTLEDTISVTVQPGWNLISLPCSVADGRTTVLFPHALSHAFAYEQFYVQRDTLQVGRGYWLKFPAAETVVFVGQSRIDDSVALTKGWNLIGALSFPVPISTLKTSPSDIIVSSFFTYMSGGYVRVDTLVPGKAYWVKPAQAGTVYEYCWMPPSEALVSPPDGYGGLADPRLMWRQSACSNIYHLQVATDSLLTNLVVDSLLSDTSYQFQFSCNALSYFWRVGIVPSQGATIWSTERRFSWAYPDSGLIAPLDGYNWFTAPRLTWRESACAASYRLRIALDSLFTSQVLDSTFTDTSYQVQSLCDTARKYWRVGVLSPSEDTVWTTVRSFRWGYVEQGLVTPGENGGTTLTPLLKWRRTNCTASYHLQLAKDSLFTNVVVDSTLTDTVYQSGLLDSAETYYWHVGVSGYWTRTQRFIAAWRYLGLGEETIAALAADWADSNVIYAGSVFSSVHLGRIFKTTDGGASWDTIAHGMTEVVDLDINPSNSNIMYAVLGINGRREHIIKSTDAGKSWARADSGIWETIEGTYPLVIAIDPQHPETLYCGSVHYIDSAPFYKSTNGGKYWFASGPFNVVAIAIDPVNTDILYAGVWGAGGVFKTTDGGNYWIKTSFRGYPNDILVNPVSPERIYVGELGFYISIDSGSTWDPDNEGFPNISRVRRILTNASGSELYCSVGYVYKKVNGEPWKNIGIEGVGITTIVLNKNILYGSYKGVYKYLR